VISLRTTNSAGYGDPCERDPELVLRDVLDELVSVDAAADLYGVVVDLERQTIDEAATARGRSR
jgi:N-methylhydantoinase B